MKSKTQIIIHICIVSVFGAGLAFSKGPGGRHHHGSPRGVGGSGSFEEAEEEPGPPPIIKALDKDLDGDISTEELKAAVESLKTLDTNGDGALSKDELIPADAKADDEKKKGRRKPHVPPVIKVLDANADGEISAEEINGAVAALLALDANEDLKLSKMETRPGRRIKR